jgi:FkbM family methyltransferase
MRVFLDIGAHLGETLSVVRARKWGFDRIVCFEPAAVCWPKIRELADERVELCTFGLSDRDQVLTLHNPGSVGASLWAAKDTSDSALESSSVTPQLGSRTTSSRPTPSAQRST